MEQVNALLSSRGIDPARLRVPRKRLPSEFGQRGIMLLVMASLRDGPKTYPQIAADFMSAKPALSRERVIIRVYRTIYKLRDRGVVRREGRL